MTNFLLSCFYARIPSDEASALLQNKPGYFLVRFSSQPGSYAISRCKRDGQVVHVRVEIVSSTEGKLDEMRVCVGGKEDEIELGKRRFKSLKEVMMESRRVLRLKHPLCASPILPDVLRKFGFLGAVEDFRRKCGDLLDMGKQLQA